MDLRSLRSPPVIGVPPVTDGPPVIEVPPVTDGPPVIGVPPVIDGPPVTDGPPVVDVPALVALQQTINPIQPSRFDPSVDYTAPGLLLFVQSEQLDTDSLSITLTQSAFLFDGLFVSEDPSTDAVWDLSFNGLGLFDSSVQQLTPLQVQEQFTTSEERAMDVTAAKLGLDPTDEQAVPTPSQLQKSLREVIKAVRARVRGGQQ